VSELVEEIKKWIKAEEAGRYGWDAAELLIGDVSGIFERTLSALECKDKVVISRKCAEFNLDRSIKGKERCLNSNGQAVWEKNIDELQQALQEQE